MDSRHLALAHDTHVPQTEETSMADELDQMGPIDYIVVEFPGSKMNGEGTARAGRPRGSRAHPHPRLRLRPEGRGRLRRRHRDRRPGRRR